MSDGRKSSRAGKSRNRRCRSAHRIRPYAWLGTGVLTLGIGSAALVLGSGHAQAEEGRPAGNPGPSASSPANTTTRGGPRQAMHRENHRAAATPRPDSRAVSVTPKIAATATISASSSAGTPPPGPRHITLDGEIYLGGNYLELGISDVGSFGTQTRKPATFVGGTPPGSNPDSIGLNYDSDGFQGGVAPALDFYVPDTPEERWSVGFNNSRYAGFSALNGSSGNAATLSSVSLRDDTLGNTLTGTFTATVDGALKVNQVHTFDINDTFYATEVTLTNVSGATLSDVEFMRSFDPDGTRSVGGSNTTTNIIGGQFETEGYSLVTAASLEGDAYNELTGNLAVAFFYARRNPNVRVYTEDFRNYNPYDYDDLDQGTGYTTTADDAIGIVFKAGDLAPGASQSFVYYTGVTTSDDPLTLVNDVASTTTGLFGDPGIPESTGVPSAEQFLRGVLAVIQLSVSQFVTGVSDFFRSFISYGNAPTTTEGLYERLRQKAGETNPDGVWIEHIKTGEYFDPDCGSLCGAKVDRFIVYIGGTDPSGQNSQTVWANSDSYRGVLKESQIDAIEAALESTDTYDPEIMLVGYSQGGMDAQNIADWGYFNVTTVVTFGNPVVKDPPKDGEYQILHIGAYGDPITSLSLDVPLARSGRAGTLFGVRTDTYELYASQWWNPWSWGNGISMHADKNTYLQAGGAFDRLNPDTSDYSMNARSNYQAIKNNIAGFSGTIVNYWT